MAVCLATMTDQDNALLRQATHEALEVLRSHAPRLRAAFSPIVDSLEALCASLQKSVATADPADTRAAVLVVTRDLIANAMEQLSPADKDSGGVVLALATLHNRIVASLEACTAAAPRP